MSGRSTRGYPVQKYRTRSNCSHALQIFSLRQIRMTNSISDAKELCNALYTSATAMLLQFIGKPPLQLARRLVISVPEDRESPGREAPETRAKSSRSWRAMRMRRCLSKGKIPPPHIEKGCPRKFVLLICDHKSGLSCKKTSAEASAQL